MIDISQKNMCSGCSACVNACPKKAIKFLPDDEGFLYPVVDKKLCVNCGMCDKVCMYKKDVEKKEILESYVVQNKNNDILKSSTSGGFFATLGEYILNNGGFVCGVLFDDELNVIHKIIGKDERELLKKMVESKYTQSNIGNCFSTIKEYLDDNKLVLFSGTPCQVLGLKMFLRKDYINLITMDFCCRSVPSPLLFNRYKEYMESKFKSKIIEYHFRKKTYGYHHGTARILFENGKVYNGSNRVDLYNKLFHSDKCSRLSCYNCKAKGYSRVSDFTIFDSWNPDLLNNEIKDNDLGYTNVLIRSEIGIKIFNTINNNFNYYKIDYFDANKYTGEMLLDSIKMKEERDNIYKDLMNSKDFKLFSKKYIKVSTKDIVLESMKKYVYKEKK